MQRLVGILPALVVVAIVAGVIVASSGGENSHELRVRFASPIVQITTGQDVRIAGRKIGEVGHIQLRNGLPVVQLKISGRDAWPLPRGTQAVVRWGSTSSYLSRYIELLPGRLTAPALPDGAVLSGKDAETSFDLDQLFRTFRGRTATDTGRLLGEFKDTFAGSAPALRTGLHDAPAGLDQTGAFLREFGANENALGRLAVAGDRTVSALAERDAALGGVVESAAGTFNQLAAHTAAEQEALDRAPTAFATSTQTLARLDRSLGDLQGLVDDLRPGARALRVMARPARASFVELRDVAPLASSTLRQGVIAAPALSRLLAVGTPFLQGLGNALTRLGPVADCLRPYGPEIAGFLSTWTGFSKDYDSVGHFLRVFPLVVIPDLLPGTTNTPANVIQHSNGIKYAMPRPPGLGVGQPWFQPQCGAGPSSLNPNDDPERSGGAG